MDSDESAPQVVVAEKLRGIREHTGRTHPHNPSPTAPPMPRRHGPTSSAPVVAGRKQSKQSHMLIPSQRRGENRRHGACAAASLHGSLLSQPQIPRSTTALRRRLHRPPGFDPPAGTTPLPEAEDPVPGRPPRLDWRWYGNQLHLWCIDHAIVAAARGPPGVQAQQGRVTPTRRRHR